MDPRESGAFAPAPHPKRACSAVLGAERPDWSASTVTISAGCQRRVDPRAITTAHPPQEPDITRDIALPVQYREKVPGDGTHGFAPSATW